MTTTTSSSSSSSSSFGLRRLHTTCAIQRQSHTLRWVSLCVCDAKFTLATQHNRRSACSTYLYVSIHGWFVRRPLAPKPIKIRFGVWATVDASRFAVAATNRVLSDWMTVCSAYYRSIDCPICCLINPQRMSTRNLSRAIATVELWMCVELWSHEQISIHSNIFALLFRSCFRICLSMANWQFLICRSSKTAAAALPWTWLLICSLLLYAMQTRKRRHYRRRMTNTKYIYISWSTCWYFVEVRIALSVSQPTIHIYVILVDRLMTPDI